jgi:hypothetical protein
LLGRGGGLRPGNSLLLFFSATVSFLFVLLTGFNPPI